MTWLVVGCSGAMLAMLYATLRVYRDLFRDEIDEIMEGEEMPAPTRRDPGAASLTANHEIPAISASRHFHR